MQMIRRISAGQARKRRHKVSVEGRGRRNVRYCNDKSENVPTAPRTTSCPLCRGQGPAISREGTVRRPGRQYGRWGGREALRPLRGSAWSSDDKNPGGSCAPVIHLRGQHVSPNTPRRTTGATSRTRVWSLCWACGQQCYVRDVPPLRHVPRPGHRGTNHAASLPIWTWCA